MSLGNALKEWEQKLREQGYPEAFREEFRKGFREGKARGMQTLILDTLRYRFGPVPRAVHTRIRGIYAFSDFKKLLGRILKANSLQDTGLL